MLTLLAGEAEPLTIAGGEAVSLATPDGGFVSTGYTPGAEPSSGGPDEWAFEVIDPADESVKATLAQPEVASADGAIDASWEPQWSDVGSGSITLPYDATILSSIDYGDVIRCVYRGVTAFSFIATTRTSNSIPADGDRGNVTWDGPGRLSALSGTRIRPSRGFGASPVEETRTFGWASVDYDDSYWGNVSKSLGQMGAPTDYWYGLANWPDPTTEWMWADVDGTPGASQVWAATGDVYFRKTFTVATAGNYQIAFAVDDRGELYLDGQRLISTGNWDNSTSSINTANVVLSAGSHTIAVWAQNNVGEYGNNPAGVLVRVGAEGTGGTILNSGAGWLALSYPWFPPAVTIGDALIKIIAEAQTAGSLPGMTVSFTATTDSAGQHWEWLEDVTAPVGSDLLTLVLRYVDSGDLDVRMSPGAFRLDAWNGGTGGTTRSLTLTPAENILSLDHNSEHRVANAAMIRYANGWTYVDLSGSDPCEETELDYGHITTEDEAIRVATETLGDLGQVREQITGEVLVRADEWPWHHYYEGDTVTVPDSTGAATSQRIVALAATIVGDELSVIPTFKDRIAEGFERHERWLKAMADGATRGVSNVPSRPKVAPYSVPIAPVASQTWSLPDWAPLTGGAWTVQTSILTRRMYVSLDSTATGTCTATLSVSGLWTQTVSIASGARYGTVDVEQAIPYGSVVILTTTGSESFGGNVTLEYLPG